MASSYIKRTFGTPTDQNKWTFSAWVKLGQATSDSVIFSAGTNASNNIDGIKMDTQDLRVFSYPGSYVYHLISDRKFRDLSAWYHVQVAYDADQSTAADRVKCYINGSQLTSFSTETYPSSGANSGHINLSGREHIIGADTGGANNNINGYVTHCHFADGQAYAPTVFGETDSTSGIWKPKTAPSVTYGNNGFFLKFENSGALGTDSSGNSNTFTVVGTPTQTIDTPSNNFCTLNPLANNTTLTFSNGNNTVYDTDNNWRSAFGSFAPNSGKWYFEVKRVGSSSNTWIGIMDTEQLDDGAYKFVSKSRGYGYSAGGEKGNSGSETAWGNTYAQNDIIGVAMDLDNSKLYFHKNGTYENSGVPTSGSTGTGSMYNLTSGFNYYPATALYSTSAGVSFNFGQGFFGTTAVASANADGNGVGAFEYAVPSGYYALSTKNIKDFG